MEAIEKTLKNKLSNWVKANPFKQRKSSKYNDDDFKKWNKAINDDCLDLIDGIYKMPSNARDLEKIMLNGADNWNHFALSGNGLVYDYDICKHYLTPQRVRESEEKSDFTKHPVNGYSMLRLHGIALAKACMHIIKGYRKLKTNKAL